MRNFFDNPLALLLVILLIVILFGASRLPNLAKQTGRSMRIFKSEIKEMKKDGGDDEPRREDVDGYRDDVRRDDLRRDDVRRADVRRAEPLEGRVVDDQAPPRATTSGDHDRRDV